MTPTERALNFARPDYGKPTPMPSRYQNEYEPVVIGSITDANTSSDATDTQAAWDAHNQRKLSNATKFYAN